MPICQQVRKMFLKFKALYRQKGFFHTLSDILNRITYEKATRRIITRYLKGHGSFSSGGDKEWQYIINMLPEIALSRAELHLKTRTQVRSSKSSEKPPSYSIVTPFFKHYDFFLDCAYSVSRAILAQNEFLVEWIIVNDDPQYDKQELLKAIPLHIRSMVHLISDGNHRGNVSVRLNEAIMVAKNEWIVFLDCDDMLEPQTFLVLNNHIDKHPDHRYISSNMLDVDERGSILRYRERSCDFEKLITRGMIAGHLKVIRRDIFEEYGLLDKSFNKVQDYDMALRIAFNEPLLFIPEYLYRCRWHRKTQSVTEDKLQQWRADKVLKHHLELFYSSDASQTPFDEVV